MDEAPSLHITREINANKSLMKDVESLKKLNKKDVHVLVTKIIDELLSDLQTIDKWLDSLESEKRDIYLPSLSVILQVISSMIELDLSNEEVEEDLKKLALKKSTITEIINNVNKNKKRLTEVKLIPSSYLFPKWQSTLWKVVNVTASSPKSKKDNEIVLIEIEHIDENDDKNKVTLQTTGRDLAFHMSILKQCLEEVSDWEVTIRRKNQ